jgi:hypothetical protein
MSPTHDRAGDNVADDQVSCACTGSLIAGHQVRADRMTLTNRWSEETLSHLQKVRAHRHERYQRRLLELSNSVEDAVSS